MNRSCRTALGGQGRDLQAEQTRGLISFCIDMATKATIGSDSFHFEVHGDNFLAFVTQFMLPEDYRYYVKSIVCIARWHQRWLHIPQIIGNIRAGIFRPPGQRKGGSGCCY